MENSPEGYAKLHEWVSRRLPACDVHVCLEATGLYCEAAAEKLLAWGYKVSVINPYRIKRFGDSQLQRNKTDKLDAATIAEYCQSLRLSEWIPPSDEVRELQSLVRHLEDLKLMRQQSSRRLAVTRSLPLVVQHLEAHLALLDEQIQAVQKAIAAHMNAHAPLREQLELLISIPGIGLQTIAKLVAECRDIRNFQDASQLVAFAGLNPHIHESGNNAKQTIISRIGSASLRAALYMPAVCALRCNPIIRRFVARLRERGVKGKAVVVAAMRKLLHIVVGVMKTGRPFDPYYAGSA